MTLRRNVGSRRSVLANSSVPARTRCAVGAYSSGSSEWATSPSCHQASAIGAFRWSMAKYLYCGAGCLSFPSMQQKVFPVVDAHAPIAVWRSVRGMPEFGRLLGVRVVSQFGDGLFQAGL